MTYVIETYLDKNFSGRFIDKNFIKDLPQNVNPYGEKGEFHTFTFDGSIFKKPIDFEIGEFVKKIIRNHSLTIMMMKENMFFGCVT